MYAFRILRRTASGVSVESSKVFLSVAVMRPVGTFSPVLPSGPVALTGPPGPVTPGPVPVPTRGSPLPRVPRPLVPPADRGGGAALGDLGELVAEIAAGLAALHRARQAAARLVVGEQRVGVLGRLLLQRDRVARGPSAAVGGLAIATTGRLLVGGRRLLVGLLGGLVVLGLAGLLALVGLGDLDLRRLLEVHRHRVLAEGLLGGLGREATITGGIPTAARPASTRSARRSTPPR
jgi:hypothetical protein